MVKLRRRTRPSAEGNRHAHLRADIHRVAQHTGHPAAREKFQVWTLKVHLDSTAELTCGDGGKAGKKSKTVFRKAIAFTDFPLPEIELWFTDGVILLPGEY